MTAPRVPRWPLTPALRLAALALLFAAAAFVLQGRLAAVFWLCAVVLFVLAAINLAKNWKRRP